MAELHLRMAQHTAGLLRQFRMLLDDKEVTRLKQGYSQRLEIRPGKHHLVAQLDWHRSEPLELDIRGDEATHVEVEYVFLVTDSWRHPKRPFAFNVSSRPAA